MTTLSRRRFLSLAAALPVLSGSQNGISASDDAFSKLVLPSISIFSKPADPKTGLVLDRVRTNGEAIAGRSLEVASAALTGFALAAMCISSTRRWMDANRVRERVRATLRHLAYDQDQVRGWYYHFVNRKSGERVWNSALSTVDTAFVLAGVLTAEQSAIGMTPKSQS